MKDKATLCIASLLSIVFITFHGADDIVRGMLPGGFSGLAGVLFLAVWLYGTLALGERRSGRLIMLLGLALRSKAPRMASLASSLRRNSLCSPLQTGMG